MSLGQKHAVVILDKIEAWFKRVQAFLEKEIKDEHVSLLTDPRRIVNADESGFPSLLNQEVSLLLTPL